MAFPNYMRPAEKTIIERLLRRGLDKGFTVSVWDGQAWALRVSTDMEAITAEVAATDVTEIHFREVIIEDGKITRPRVGSVFLIHGNDEDVIHDHTDNKIMEELCAT